MHTHTAPSSLPRTRLALLVFACAALAAIALGHLPHGATTVTHLGRAHGGALGTDGGALPANTSVFDDSVPAVTKLDPALLRALRRAATDAGAIRFLVNGGWRSPAYEDALRRGAIAKYGSEREAAKWVATGTTSPHVSGDAVDVGPPAAAAWLAAHGAAYGLCQIYANEPWHYELRRSAVGGGCPTMVADASEQPDRGGDGR